MERTNPTTTEKVTKLHSGFRAKHFWHIGLFILVGWAILVALSLWISPTATVALIKALPNVAIGLFVKLPVVLGVPALLMWPVCRFFIGTKSLGQIQREIVDENNGGLGALLGGFYLAMVLATTVVVFFS